MRHEQIRQDCAGKLGIRPCMGEFFINEHTVHLFHLEGVDKIISCSLEGFEGFIQNIIRAILNDCSFKMAALGTDNQSCGCNGAYGSMRRVPGFRPGAEPEGADNSST